MLISISRADFSFLVTPFAPPKADKPERRLRSYATSVFSRTPRGTDVSPSIVLNYKKIPVMVTIQSWIQWFKGLQFSVIGWFFVSIGLYRCFLAPVVRLITSGSTVLVLRFTVERSLTLKHCLFNTISIIIIVQIASFQFLWNRFFNFGFLSSWVCH